MSDHKKERTDQQMPKRHQASLGVLVQGAEKTIDNAERLFHEANILARSDAVARALCLHQISLEECSKINNFGAWAVSLILDLSVDQEKVLAAFRRHKSKNRSNAYLLEGSDEEKGAKSRGDWAAALEAFKQTQEQFHETSNEAKNASLYVDWIDEKFVAPHECITKEMLAEIADRNAEFLEYARSSLAMLKRLDQSPDEMRDLLSGFVDKTRKLREEKPKNLISEMNTLLSNFFAEVKGKLKE